MKICINAGHDINLDSGAVGYGVRECDIVKDVSELVCNYLANVGIETIFVQDDDLGYVCSVANDSACDYFISIHCNAFNSVAKGTEVCVYSMYGQGAELGQCIQNQIVNSLETIDRGLKERKGLYVLRGTNMPACLVELAFIDNYEDNTKLVEQKDEFARCVARGVTDFLEKL